jgi:hypothetical protein
MPTGRETPEISNWTLPGSPEYESSGGILSFDGGDTAHMSCTANNLDVELRKRE